MPDISQWQISLKSPFYPEFGALYLPSDGLGVVSVCLADSEEDGMLCSTDPAVNACFWAFGRTPLARPRSG